ncbi:hypothetical protein [Solirubrum puertoriconensis]|uniref:Uncharacterized protein n=1 Tax=Solirubrum puertoriconensis TaxID=1751427 RepID=A0A9X0L638_SOLP1|nr:hypothetical protein [Solirubrum puertoriconensis]KUG09337.1 hypothetical protein ASU33_16505 [Solirubrum puertoriconensis]
MSKTLLQAGLIVSILYLSAFGVQAQSAAPSVALTVDSAAVVAPVQSQVAKRTASTDTIMAVMKLFSRRRGGGAGWVASAGLVTLRGYVASRNANTTTINGVVVEQSDADVTPVLLVGGAVAAYGVSKLVRFSNGRLDEVLDAYNQGQPLPQWVQRRLKPKFFLVQPKGK